MNITTEIRLVDFETWSGATDTVDYLTHDELNEVEALINEIYMGVMDETDVNDFLWFERDMIAEHLGYNDFDEIMER